MRRGHARDVDDRVAECAAGVVDPAGGDGADRAGAERCGGVIGGVEQARDVVGVRARSPGRPSGATSAPAAAAMPEPVVQAAGDARVAAVADDRGTLPRTRCAAADRRCRGSRRRRRRRAVPRPMSESTSASRSCGIGAVRRGSPRQRLDAPPQSRETVGLRGVIHRSEEWCLRRSAPSSRVSRGRTARTWPSSCWRRATRSTASCVARRRFNRSRIDHLHHDEHIPGRNLHLHYGDVTDAARMAQLVHDIRPHEVYNLAAQSHVRVSFDEPGYTAQATGVSTLNLLEAIRTTDTSIRFYQASTSEMFGASPPPQNEDTPVLPAQPLRRGQGLLVLDHQELPRGVRHVRGQRPAVQPRVPAPRRDVRDAQDHARRRQHRQGPADRAVDGQPRLRSATGATPRSTPTACGGCCRPTSRRTSSWPPARRTRSATSSPSRSSTPA